MSSVWDVFRAAAAGNQAPAQQPAHPPAASTATPRRKAGNDCDQCNQAESECVNTCVAKSAASGRDPATDMEQAAKNAACIGACEEAKANCTCP